MNFFMVRDTNNIDMKCISKLYPVYSCYMIHLIHFYSILYILCIEEVIFTYNARQQISYA